MFAQSQPDYTARLDRVRSGFDEKKIDSLLVFGPANRRYLTGFTPSDGQIGESSGAVLISRDRAALLVSPLYIEVARHESTVVEPVELRGRQSELLANLLKEWGVSRLGFERDYTLYGFYEDLTEKLEGTVQLVSVRRLVEPLRIVKDSTEKVLMREAARIADEAYIRVTASLTPGATEREVARALDQTMEDLGADSPSFPTIVAAGLNSARPHHEPGNTVINAGDPVVIDMGAKYRGYCSDMTRSFCYGQADTRYNELYNLVLKSHEDSKAAVTNGANGKEVDAIARDILKGAGFEKEFNHSLGHGVGLDVHEAPSLSTRSEDVLQPGMVVTIEPGIYFGDWGGIRIEDSVFVTDDGYDTLNHAPKSPVIS